MTQCDRIIEVLRDGKPHTMEEIHERAGFMRLNSRISDLRKKRNLNITCEYRAGHYTYQLVGTVQKSDLAAGRAPGLSPRSDNVPAARGIETPSASPVQLSLGAV